MESKIYGLVFPKIRNVFIPVVEEVGDGRFGIEIEMLGNDIADTYFQMCRPLYSFIPDIFGICTVCLLALRIVGAASVYVEVHSRTGRDIKTEQSCIEKPETAHQRDS